MKINPVFSVSTFILELTSVNVPRSRSVHFIKLEDKDKQAKLSRIGKSKNFRLTDGGNARTSRLQSFFTHSCMCFRWTQKVCNIAFMLKPMPTIKNVSPHTEAGFSL